MTKKIATSALMAAALLALPVMGAQAKQDGKGSKAERPAKSEKKASKGEHGKQKRCSKVHSVGFQVKGTLAGYTADDVTLTVKRGNKHARTYLGDGPATFTLAGAKVSFVGVTDANGDGKVGFEDVAEGDKVKVGGKLAKPKKRCEGESKLTVRRVKVVRPDANEDAETEAPETGDTPVEPAPAIA